MNLKVKHPLLAAPAFIGGLELKNKIIMAPAYRSASVKVIVIGNDLFNCLVGRACYRVRAISDFTRLNGIDDSISATQLIFVRRPTRKFSNSIKLRVTTRII